MLIGYLRPKTANPNYHPEPTPEAPDGAPPSNADGADEAPPEGPAPNDAAPDASTDPTGGLELYRIEARSHVHVYNDQDQAWGDHGVYDMDSGLMMMTGDHLRVKTPKDVMTARDLLQYYPKTKVSIGRGEATVTTNDGKRITGDILESIGMTAAQKAARDAQNAREARAARRAGRPFKPDTNTMDRAFAWGHVVVRTPSQVATSDRGVYLFGPELARLAGHVHVTQGQNVNNGAQALVNMKTGISTMLPGRDSPVQGLVIPNESRNNP
ncbi:hypothetical protein E3E12_06560 [Formicincola oecophyllae]|uniref:Organic solvent tolerance-like N-terminal domain-containing protein n=2 Tax=Formicincola oecophyllae TaxID=2558361 RepID=A0A4Y6UBE9_9PROT|nr:hypothetical protein E3E12_06560 [Formicincola oecophyllae]